MNQVRPKVGLALGSGALRGLAHIGVLMALEEARIPIDYIAGTSIGAVIGGIYACGTDLHLLWEMMLQLDEKAFFDYTVPRRGFIKGQRVQQLIATLTGNKTFDDTRIPFTAVACDLCAGTAVPLSSGRVHEAVRASISVPGVFEPVTRDGVMLVDGGLVQRVPTQTVRDMGADVVIGVDVGARGEPVEVRDLMGIFMRTIELMEWNSIKYRIVEECDVLVLPIVYEMNAWTLARAEEVMRRGYDACMEKMPEIQRATMGAEAEAPALDSEQAAGDMA